MYGTNPWGIDKAYTGHIGQVGIYISYPCIYHVYTMYMLYIYIYIIHIPHLHLSLVYTMYIPCVYILYPGMYNWYRMCLFFAGFRGSYRPTAPPNHGLEDNRALNRTDVHDEADFDIPNTEEGERQFGRRESENSGHPMEQYPSSWPKYGVALIVCQYHS